MTEILVFQSYHQKIRQIIRQAAVLHRILQVLGPNLDMNTINQRYVKIFFFFIYFLGSVAVKCKKTSTFRNVRIFCLKMTSSSRKPTKKFFYLKNSYTSKCKIRNVRVQRHNHNHRSTNCWFE